ncbi:MAG: hypothetical protein E2591_00810 [Achromobacter sp.]|uniref:CrpP-related protein n=2 Tax=Achromobacter TaxID=222 RepID=UPI0012C84E60|nr:hypothetical protein [Achromobacter sp.]CAB3959594.1 hypothetical protein LMG6103_05846 [Achromobacter piechaudii]
MQREDIQKLGAQAARDGLTLWDCPFLRACEMPGHTGESIAQWEDKVRAWEAGWRAQVRLRPPIVPPYRSRLSITSSRRPAVVLSSG